MNEQEKKEILEEFKKCGLDASYHYADDTGKEWHLAYPLVEKCMKLAKEHIELHPEMAEIAKNFGQSIDDSELDQLAIGAASVDTHEGVRIEIRETNKETIEA